MKISVPGNTFQKIGFLIQNTESKTTDYHSHRLLVLISREVCFQEKPTRPIGRPLPRRSVDIHWPWWSYSWYFRTPMNKSRHLKVWKITRNLNSPNTFRFSRQSGPYILAKILRHYSLLPRKRPLASVFATSTPTIGISVACIWSSRRSR